MLQKYLTWLEDLVRSCEYIASDTSEMTFDDYLSDRRTRQAVERNFEIIGEVLIRLERADPMLVARISRHRQVIDFQNRIAHGYDDIDEDLVWEIIQNAVPVLRAEAEAIINDTDQHSRGLTRG